MKKVIRLTESQLENIIRKVIAEQEDYERDWTPEQKEAHMKGAMELYNTVKPDMGGMYCFSSKQDKNSVIEALKTNIKNSGIEGKELYKIKELDNPTTIKNMSKRYDIIGVNSKSCNLEKNPRIGDVIIYH
jgi:hypothetical protein